MDKVEGSDQVKRYIVLVSSETKNSWYGLEYCAVDDKMEQRMNVTKTILLRWMFGDA